MKNDDDNPLWVIVLAGGRGTRFWPVSRRAVPKQCVSVDGDGPTMIQSTVARLSPLVPPERVLVITGPEMEATIRNQLSMIPAENILVEPSPRNTAPCIGWGTVEVGRRAGGRAVVAVLPSDHHIGRPAALRQVLQDATGAALSTNALITLGIEPSRPDTGFGYLELGATMGTWGETRFQMVERFTEKPEHATAAKWLSAGTHLWNAGMFVFTVDAMRDAFRGALPDTAVALEQLQLDPRSLHKVWPEMEATSIDYGVMERSRHLLTAPCKLDWSDLGSWVTAGELLPEVEGGRGLARAVLSVDSGGCVVRAPGKAVALVGVKDLVIVDTDDALLVMHRDRAQDIRGILARLDASGAEDLT